MTIYAIYGWQTDDVPHWSVAFIEAESAAGAGDILASKIGPPGDDYFDRLETVWAVTPRSEWEISEIDHPFEFILGGGCR